MDFWLHRHKTHLQGKSYVCKHGYPDRFFLTKGQLKSHLKSRSFPARIVRVSLS